MVVRKTKLSSFPSSLISLLETPIVNVEVEHSREFLLMEVSTVFSRCFNFSVAEDVQLSLILTSLCVQEGLNAQTTPWLIPNHNMHFNI